jgi:hypothetical protein
MALTRLSRPYRFCRNRFRASEFRGSTAILAHLRRAAKSHSVRAFGWLHRLTAFAALNMPSADFSVVFSAGCPSPSEPHFRAFHTAEISRGKTRYLHRVNAGFTKHTPSADGGLCGQRPARPRCVTPHIRFLFVVPRFRIGLPSDPASRRRPCPSPCLRLCENLAIGLSPTK